MSLGRIPPCLPISISISISIGRPKVRDIPLGDGVSGGRERYFGTCWSGRWAPINQLLLPPFAPGPDKAAVVLILTISLLLQTNSVPSQPSRAGPSCLDQ